MERERPQRRSKMTLRKKKKIIVITQQLSRLTDVFDAELQSIEFVDPEGEETPEEEVVEEANLSTAQVDALNETACEFK